MRLAQLIEFGADVPVFTVHELADALDIDPRRVREQLSRWQPLGYVMRIGAGLWVLGPYADCEPIDITRLASLIDPECAITAHSALAHHRVTPTAPLGLTCVTHGRPRTVLTPSGPIRFRHLAPRLWFDYAAPAGNGPIHVAIATPNKALLDLLHFVPSARRWQLFDEIGPMDWSPIEPWELRETARAHYPPGVQRTANAICGARRGQTGEPDTLPTPEIRRIRARMRRAHGA